MHVTEPISCAAELVPASSSTMNNALYESRRATYCAPMIAAIAMMLVVRCVQAQHSALVAGSRIRIQGADEKQVQEGTFRALTPDSLTYTPGLSTSTRTIPLSRVGKIEVSRYNLRARSVLGDAAIGSAVGLGGTLAIAGGCAVFHGDCLGLILAAPVLIGGGFVIGAVIGSQNRSQHWDQVYPQERSASLLIAPMPHGGLAIGVSVSFGEAGLR
jgi:hypothetical protein